VLSGIKPAVENKLNAGIGQQYNGQRAVCNVGQYQGDVLTLGKCGGDVRKSCWAA